MSHPPILLFDFDGVVITQKALEYAALVQSRKKFFGWKNIETLRLIDFARLFEESDSSNRLKAIYQSYFAYKKYIPSRWKRVLFFIVFRRFYPTYEKYEEITPGLKAILAKLKSSNIILGIVSNTSKKRLDYFRNKLDLDKYFSVFISRDDTPYRKPNPYPIFLSLRMIRDKFNTSIDRNRVYFFGDLPSDIETAKNAKIKSIALLTGHGRPKDLKKLNPTFIIKDLYALESLEPFKKFLLN
jgi:HAD superfamily hydrolase (TIGR01549 family)